MQIQHQKIEEGKKWLYFALFSTLLWGLVAHGYHFLQSSFNHDSLAEFNGLAFGNKLKMSLGRFLVPLYRNVFRTDLTLPWLIGVLALLWLGLAVFLVLRIFDIRSKGIAFLTAGIFTVNTAVMATAASYLHDFDSNMLAVLCAVMAVYLWRKVPWGSLLGACFVTALLGIYQCSISITITLAMFVCILDLMRGEDCLPVLKKGFQAIGMILLGGILYFVALQVVNSVIGVSLESGNVNSLDKILEMTPATIISDTMGAYRDCFRRLFQLLSPYPEGVIKRVTVLLAGIFLLSVAVFLWDRKRSLGSKLLCIALIVLLPLGMNITYVLSGGEVHDLMVFALWLSYLLPLLCSLWLAERWKNLRPKYFHKLPQFISTVLVFLLLYGNVQAANTLYLKKDLEEKAFFSLMTQVVYDMEQVDGYIRGTTPVVFAGRSPLIQSVSGTEDYTQLVGVWHPGPIVLQEAIYYQAYFNNILVRPAQMADYAAWHTMLKDPRVAEMPIYPEKGSIALLDDTLVVHLGG